MAFPRKYLFLPLISAPIIALDQWTKKLIDESFSLGESLPLIDGFFSLTYVRNRGAAFGMFANSPEPVREIALRLVPIIAIVLIGMMYRKASEHERLLPISLSLVIGGAIGNMIDRLRLHYVIDFLDFYIKDMHWPAFNVADSAICVGIGLMAFHMFFIEPKMKPQAKRPPA